ncbi:MAG: glycosyltransferase [Pseudomonadota bacterium]
MSPHEGGAPLRVLLIARAPVGGAWRHILDLTDGLLERGFQLGIVVDSMRASDHVRATLERFRPRLDLGVHTLSIPRAPGMGDLSIIRACRRLIAELKPDIVHGHSAKGGLYARLASWGTPAKAVYTPHGGSLHLNKASLNGRLILATEKALIKITDRFIFESAFSADGFAEKIGDTGGLSSIIHNGLRNDEFAGAPTWLDEPPYDFAFVGEMRAIKGVDVLLEALCQVTHPSGRSLKVLMLGDGPMLADYKAYADALGLGDEVHFKGRRPAIEAFEATNTIVVPSRAESLPYVVMETIARGRNVIASDVGGIAEIFGPTRNALIQPDDVEALAGALQSTLTSTQADMRDILDARYAHMTEHFHVDTMVDAVAETYRALC